MRVIRAALRAPLPLRRTSTRCFIRALSSATDGAASASEPRPLRVGVVGLGAIGTILFARLGEVALGGGASPPLAVDALVKPRHLAALFAGSRTGASKYPTVALHEQHAGAAASATAATTRIAFRHVSERLAEAAESSSVRIRVLTSGINDGVSRDEVDPSERLDVVLVAVKAYDSAATVRGLQRHHAQLIKDDALVVLLQNGIGAAPADDGAQQQEKCRWRYAHGVTYVGGRALSFGNVAVSGVDAATTFIAPVSSPSSGGSDADEESVEIARKIDALGRALTAGGLRWERLTAATMRTMQWKKLIVNAGINPIASVLNTQNKGVGACEWSRACVETVVREAFEVASKEGVAFQSSEEELVREVLQVAANTGSNVCSMVADLRRGSRTEIEDITGRIVALGRTHSVPTPANALLLQLVKALEAQQTHLASRRA